MGSIRGFLITVSLSLVILFNAVAAINGYQSGMAKADKLFDAQLINVAGLIGRLHAQRGSSALIEPACCGPSQGEIAYQIWQGGELLAASANANGAAISPLEPGFNYANFASQRWRTAAYYNTEDDSWTLVAQSSNERYSLAESVVVQAVWPLVVGLPVLGIILWLILRHGLKPLRHLANALRSKQADDLSPIHILPLKLEIAQIEQSSNQLLQRLAASLERERQFAADAAHELRTPLSVLKIQLFNIKSELAEGTLSANNLVPLTTTIKRFEHVIEQILLLNRIAPDQYQAQWTNVELLELVQEVVARDYSLFEQKQQQISLEGEPVIIRGDRFALDTLLQNLIINASKYTPAQGQIRIILTADEQTVVLTVEDSGIGIPLEERKRIFDRFYRIGGDRHASEEVGCGLGLAIISHLAQLHRGRLEIADSAFESGTKFTLWLPNSEEQGVSVE